jgi:uncharacterized membrane protein YkoI
MRSTTTLLTTLWEEVMNYRNVPLLAGALMLLASVAGAQQATSTTPSAPKPVARSSASTQAKTRSTASAKAKVNISADSAKAIVAAQAPGMTVKSERLRGKSSHRMYYFQLAEQGKKGVRHATVDANTGAFNLMSASTTGAAKPKMEHKTDTTKAKPGTSR